MKIEFVGGGAPVGEGDALALLAFEDAKPSSALAALDARLSGKIAALIARGRFKGHVGEKLSVLTPDGLAADSLLVVGAGPDDAWGGHAAELVAAHAYSAVKSSGARVLVIDLQGSSAEVAAQAAFGLNLASYRFDKYRTNTPQEQRHSIEATRIVVDEPDAAARAYDAKTGLAEAICLARDLVSEPANVLYPAEFARRVKELTQAGLLVEVLGEKEMKDLGMGALLGVGQGSTRESQLAIIQWRGSKDPKSPPVAFVGKGVCFDTGGISLKPADGMEDMIWDMGGAGAVAGLMHALAGRKAKVNVIGILGLVENMPDGNAQRPGDIVTSMSGQTIEVINTDAEGRLVLADALWYCQQRFKPKFMVDLATLTGAIVVALGSDLAGMYSNDEALSANLLKASDASGDTLWRMPLPASYEKQIDSFAADVKNTGGRPGGSITAALFLQRFTNGVPWAHLDIAATAWRKSSSNPVIPDGATGFGVRLLNDLVAANYED